MEILKEVIPLVFAGSLFALVLAVGLESTLGELLALFKAPGRLVRAVLAVNVLVPLAAVVSVGLFPLPRAAAAGILLMAISPVPPLVPGKQLKVGGGRAASYAVYTALILLAVIVVPLWILIIDNIYGVRISLPPLAVASNVALTVVLPLAIGLAIRKSAPGLAPRLPKPLRAIAMLLLLIAFIPMLAAAWPAFRPLIGNGVLAIMALIVAVALLAGHILGGPEPGDRAALAVTAATRHPGIALMIAGANTHDPHVPAAILGFLIVGTIVATPYQFAVRRHPQDPDAGPREGHVPGKG